MTSATDSMAGKVCLVTGGTRGIGLETARDLAARGATVVLVSRNEARCQRTVDDLRRESGNPNVDYLVSDLSLLRGVNAVAEAFLARYDRLDVLINNAGAIFSSRQVTAEGLEKTFALNHMAYFVLTERLLPLLRASAPARIINVSSDAHRTARIHFDDLQLERGYGSQGFTAYGQSKLANLLFTYELARRLEGSGVTVNALHPGFVSSGFGHNNGLAWRLLMPVFSIFAISSERGAETPIYLATAPEVAASTGLYFAKKQPVRSSPASYDEAAARRLWDVSEALRRELLEAVPAGA